MKQAIASTDQVSQFLLENPLWSIKENKLHREFVFNDFAVAFEFMAQTAQFCESINHHPEWSNIYNKVFVYLITHENNKISNKDLKLANIMNNIAKKLT